MKTKSFLSVLATALLLASTIVQAGGPYPPPPQPPDNSFSGRAFVVKAKVPPLLNTTIVDTGQLPDVGGVREENAVDLNIPGLLTAQVLHAKTTGGQTLNGTPNPNVAESEAEVLGLDLSVLGIGITADVIRAMSHAESTAKTKSECAKPKLVLSGDSEIANLVVAGVPIVVAPNSTTTLNVGLLSVKVVTDEQIKQAFVTNGQPGAEITTNAVHITIKSLLGVVADVIISSAHSDIICGLKPSDP
ncbi:MAG: choice-of-anchor P family protein [bacterium]